MTDAIRDENHVPVTLGVSSEDVLTTLPFTINQATGGLVVDQAASLSGPGSSVDNSVPRFNGTDGSALQDSGVIIDDSNIVNAAGYKAGGTAAVADGTYTLGLGTPVSGQNGTITVKGGIITAIQEVM